MEEDEHPVVEQHQDMANQDPDLNKQCWVCFASPEDDASASWVKPCKCKGTTKWVHQSCLQRWIDEKQKGNTFAKVKCSQCGAEYIIRYPPLDWLTNILERVDRLGVKASAYMTGGVLLGSLYFSTVTYGAITVFVVYGHTEGRSLMLSCDTSVLLVALPFIPVALIAFQSLKWEDELVRLLARFTFDKDSDGNRLGGQQQPVAAVRDQTRSATRILCSALSLPMISKILGGFLFESRVQSPLLRAALGGAVFLTVKGAANVYFKYRQMQRRQRRLVVDFVEPVGVGVQAGGGADENAEQNNGDNNLMQP